MRLIHSEGKRHENQYVTETYVMGLSRFQLRIEEKDSSTEVKLFMWTFSGWQQILETKMLDYFSGVDSEGYQKWKKEVQTKFSAEYNRLINEIAVMFCDGE